MADPFIGEIRMTGFNFAPQPGWAQCNGQLLAVSDNPALFSLLSCTFGGDCRSSFALPDFRGRVPMHFGSGPGLTPRVWGEKAGYEYVTLTIAEMPNHSHEVAYTAPQYTLAGSIKPKAKVGFGTKTDNPENNYLTNIADGFAADNNKLMGEAEHDLAIAQSTPGSVIESAKGGSQSHYNMQPYLVVNFIIALDGIYPSRS